MLSAILVLKFQASNCGSELLQSCCAIINFDVSLIHLLILLDKKTKSI